MANAKKKPDKQEKKQQLNVRVSPTILKLFYSVAGATGKGPGEFLEEILSKRLDGHSSYVKQIWIEEEKMKDYEWKK